MSLDELRSADCLKITLPIPPRELHPNHTVGSRGGRLAKARQVKSYREGAQGAAIVARQKSPMGDTFPWPAAIVRIVWYAKTRRRIDRDNIIGALKPGWDGLQDGGIIENDADLTHLPPERQVDPKRPRVELFITRAEKSE